MFRITNSATVIPGPSENNTTGSGTFGGAGTMAEEQHLEAPFSLRLFKMLLYLVLFYRSLLFSVVLDRFVWDAKLHENLV